MKVCNMSRSNKASILPIDDSIHGATRNSDTMTSAGTCSGLGQDLTDEHFDFLGSTKEMRDMIYDVLLRPAPDLCRAPWCQSSQPTRPPAVHISNAPVYNCLIVNKQFTLKYRERLSELMTPKVSYYPCAVVELPIPACIRLGEAVESWHIGIPCEVYRSRCHTSSAWTFD
ncbi:hypothetical protein BAUCODRAFT_537988 [Baudoinia panamericana UAMH 10762]|uniref:Uncharacterized protein n=1 Tax=Baudoinia panamericana (strain UAMH 10762) TaxID=717646 RepID=M2LM07_BAUPA|nr:uncharacterized protein BAUCODRAFT_537988 [Baudoinia panamericana UAMH 10762]EMC95357.1 hypothetical protein BAUCODRAFT_537988 [Baudoinia panamericana UAMH 10762]